MAKVNFPCDGKDVSIESSSFVLVGANGSGKSRLGITIEESHENTHRVSAQRSLVFGDEIALRSATAAEAQYLYGNYRAEPRWDDLQRIQQSKERRRQSRWSSRPESHLLDDFNHLLAYLLALEQAQNSEFKKAYKSGERPDKYPESKLDCVRKLWRLVMPHRDIEIADNRLRARGPDSTDSYHGLGMSDGERVTFYLIAQAICVPDNALVIIDEPEIHLHKAIQAKLWDAIEAERADCTFLYITHDLEFAASRSGAVKIWVRGYDGKNWKWDEIPHVDGFPVELVLEVAGSRLPVLFVEGTTSSIDTQLYRRIYPQFHVIPREGCTKVVESTIALRQAEGFHATSASGVIDRDYRAEEVVAGLEKDGVYTTPVAEAENAICLPCVVKAAAKHFRRDESEILANTTARAIAFLQRQLDHQIKERASQEIRHALSHFSSKGIGSKEEFEQAVSEFQGKIDPGAFYEDARQKYQTVIDTQDFEGMLRLFNNKGLEDTVAKAIGFSDGKTLREWVVAEIDNSLTAENPSEIGTELLAGLQQAFPVIPIPSVASSTQSATGTPAEDGDA